MYDFIMYLCIKNIQKHYAISILLKYKILTKNFLIFQQVREELKHKKELDLQEITIPEEDDDDDDLR